MSHTEVGRVKIKHNVALSKKGRFYTLKVEMNVDGTEDCRDGNLFVVGIN